MIKKKVILLIDSPHPHFKQKIEDNGFVCETKDKISKEEVLECIGNYFGAVVRSRFDFDKEFFDKAKNLKFIARIGAGTDHIDVEYAKSKGIQCVTSPEGNRDALGEHAVGLILSLLNHICQGNRQIKQGIWNREQNRGNEINGKTIGIIGYGNMGGALAKRLSSFGVNIIAYDKYKFNYSDEIVTEVSLETLFQESDFLSLHVPLTDETRYMVDDEFINRFKKDIFIINTARGQIVKTEDLVKNLKSGKIKGAALDVLEYENPSYSSFNKDAQPEVFNYLCQSENVILSPHVAGITVESDFKHADVLASKIIAEFGGSL